MKDKLYITFLPPTDVAIWQPETIAYLGAAVIPDDTSLYFGGTAYQITGAEIWTALDACVVGWKTDLGLTLFQNNLSTRFKYIYPRIGGTAATHALNLVDPTLYTGTFSGGWTHDGSGALPNGTNGYMNTGFIPSALSVTNCSFGFDSKTDTNGLFSDFGGIDTSNGDVNMYTRVSGNNNTRLAGNGVNSAVAVADSLGLFAIKRDNTLNYKAYKEGSVLATHTVTSRPIFNSTIPITEAAQNANGSIIQYSPRKRTLLFAGTSMTDTEMADFTTTWRTLETTLNR
jgi:hypothetical protein